MCEDSGCGPVTSAVLPQLSLGGRRPLPAQLSPCSPRNPCQEERGNMSRPSPTASCHPVLPPTRRDAGRGLGTGQGGPRLRGPPGCKKTAKPRRSFRMEVPPRNPPHRAHAAGVHAAGIALVSSGDRAPARPLQASRASLLPRPLPSPSHPWVWGGCFCFHPTKATEEQ